MIRITTYCLALRNQLAQQVFPSFSQLYNNVVYLCNPMIPNVLWLEENLLLVSIGLPIETIKLKNHIDMMFAKELQKRISNGAILVDAKELHPPLYETALADFQTVLIKLEAHGLVVIYGLPSLVEQLFKRTLFSHPFPRYPIYFTNNHDEAIAHQQQSITTTKLFNVSPSSQKSPEECGCE